MFRALQILLIAGAFFQTSQLRACTIEKIVLGSNCHEEEHCVNAKAPCLSVEGSHAHAHLCICKIERFVPTARQIVPIDLTACEISANEFSITDRIRFFALPSPSLAPLERSTITLPMLN